MAVGSVGKTNQLSSRYSANAYFGNWTGLRELGPKNDKLEEQTVRSLNEVSEAKEKLYNKFQEISNQGYGIVYEKFAGIELTSQSSSQSKHTGLIEEDKRNASSEVNLQNKFVFGSKKNNY